MKYGLIGEHLGHSFSKEVHGMLSDYEYEIREIEKSDLDGFMKEADFKAYFDKYRSYISDEAWQRLAPLYTKYL